MFSTESNRMMNHKGRILQVVELLLQNFIISYDCICTVEDKYLVDKISSRLICLSSSVTPNKYLIKLKSKVEFSIKIHGPGSISNTKHKNTE